MAATKEAPTSAGPSTATPPVQPASTEPPAEHIPQTYAAAPPNLRPVPEIPPDLPPRPPQFEPPPKRKANGAGDNPRTVQYTRDPQKLIAYLVPFPSPDLREGFTQQADPIAIPNRFLIYTPPPPPLLEPKPEEGKEGRLHKVQRKWEGELRKAKTSDVDKKSWRGLRYASARVVDRGIAWITSSNIDFLCRIPKDKKVKKDKKDKKSSASTSGASENASGSGRLEELVFYHPQSLPGTPNEVQREFVNSLARSKKRAYRDTAISILIFPPVLVIDILFPFGGLSEIDAVWAVCSIRGAKRARAVTKRLDTTPQDKDAEDGDEDNDEDLKKQKKHKKHKKPKDDDKLKLTFTPTEQLEILRRYLAYECHKRDPRLFKHGGEETAPTETMVLEALGWTPSQNTTVGDKRNHEDEQWEVRMAKEDLQRTMRKGAKEWVRWCKRFQKNPGKALKK
ncbi:hypothetical protein FKW77_010884 [Venturia effusa]|uniref:Secreted protein n=1 Tax=Venturia effusa TaxID=50376 RepID=A0A517KYR5_9PEZI|nr:hypothetical protein FKW77_010884 [Venturia effusa]